MTDEKDYLKKLSFEKLDALVSQNNISYYSLAQAVELPSSFFSEWKRGKMLPGADKLKKVATYFGVTIDYFLDDSDSKEATD